MPHPFPTFRSVPDSLSSSIFFIGVYRPPLAKTDWFTLFNDLTLNLITKGKIVIMGDTNADILRPTVYPAKEMLTLFALAGTRPPSSVTPTSVGFGNLTWARAGWVR